MSECSRARTTKRADISDQSLTVRRSRETRRVLRRQSSRSRGYSGFACQTINVWLTVARWVVRLTREPILLRGLAPQTRRTMDDFDDDGGLGLPDDDLT